MIEEAVLRQIKKPDAIIFLGDGLRDIISADIGDIPIYSVAGNCDAGSVFFDNSTPIEQNLVIGDKRIFFTHGHKYGVKSTLSPLLCEGVKRGADIILFGHTHMPTELCEYAFDKRIQLFNPGSIGGGATYGVINTSNGTLVTNVAKLYG
jgi:putative phosphoesterase